MKSIFLALLIMFAANGSSAQMLEYDAEADSGSLWDDPNESNPYFKKQKIRTAADVKKEQAKKKEYYKTTFKKRVYMGPSPAAAAEQAKAKSVESFKSHLPQGQYDVRFDSWDYDDSVDELSFKNLVFKPREKTPDAEKIPYYFKAEEARFAGFNLGEIYGTPQNETGTIRLSKLDVPVWNENSVKVGKITFDAVVFQGKGMAFMKEKQGNFTEIAVDGMRSEKIINETIVNNIVRSKIFAVQRAVFKNVVLSAAAFESVKNQSLDGVSFSSARVNGKDYTSPQAVLAEAISYSARVLNPDLVKGARLEGAKPEDKQKPTMEQVRKNAAENNAERAKLVKEMKK